jgi:hypothetical protein
VRYDLPLTMFLLTHAVHCVVTAEPGEAVPPAGGAAGGTGSGSGGAIILALPQPEAACEHPGALAIKREILGVLAAACAVPAPATSSPLQHSVLAGWQLCVFSWGSRIGQMGSRVLSPTMLSGVGAL